jgi:hypothetical protein
MQNPQHLDRFLYRPVIDYVGRYDEAAKAQPAIVAALAHARGVCLHSNFLGGASPQPMCAAMTTPRSERGIDGAA